MTRPDDEANTDAPLVPEIRPPNRSTTSEPRESDSIRQEIRRLRSRVDDLESDLARRGDD